ncbi:MAG: hypothetical protein AVDCRST_MAG51-2144, partial [uncultured Ramlibacter sp.]
CTTSSPARPGSSASAWSGNCWNARTRSSTSLSAGRVKARWRRCA